MRICSKPLQFQIEEFVGSEGWNLVWGQESLLQSFLDHLPRTKRFSTHRICWWYVHAIMTREILRIKFLALLCRFGVSRWSVPAVPTKDGNLETCIFSCAFKESEAISVPHVIWCYRCYSKKKREIHVISSKLLIPQITGHSQTHWISRDMMTFLPLFFITKKARWSTSPNFI